MCGFCFADLFVMLYRLECVELVNRKTRWKPNWGSLRAASSIGRGLFSKFWFPPCQDAHFSFVNNWPSLRLRLKDNTLRKKGLPWWVFSTRKLSSSPDSPLNLAFSLIYIMILITMWNSLISIISNVQSIFITRIWGLWRNLTTGSQMESLFQIPLELNS